MYVCILPNKYTIYLINIFELNTNNSYYRILY